MKIKLSKKNYKLLLNAAEYISANRAVNIALKQFFAKKHKIKLRVLLKKGYRDWAGINLMLCNPVLPEDSLF